MAARKEIRGPEHYGYDLTTTAGFMAAFDAEILRIRTDKSWCQQAADYAYRESGIPAPSQRKSSHPLAGIDPKWIVLSDEGKMELRRVQEAEDAKLDGYKAGALRAIVWALNSAGAHGKTYTQRDADSTCDALGFEHVIPVRTYASAVSPHQHTRFTTAGPLSDQVQERLRLAVDEAVRAALLSVCPDATITQHGGVYVGSATQSDRTWGLPGSGEAITE